MKLPAWLKKEGMSVARFARALNRSQAMMWYVVNGQRNVSITLANQIVEFCRGEVTHADLEPPSRRKPNSGKA